MVRDLVHEWKIGDKDFWGRCRQIDFTGWAKDMKIFVFQGNDQQSVSSTEKDFNI